ncbi:unnamed protein product [Soboliphyme baturini]|uniref:HYPK_UBA domain-containing protein n=1 Tax=Soboliphyme baturini TaxID=241478 RepID=A0A183J6F1_9BILA|nr:unnamed protein product [Soboliphyme baturini]
MSEAEHLATAECNDNDSKKLPEARKHDSGAADLEKVTEYVEEKELSAHVHTAVSSILGTQKSKEKQSHTVPDSNKFTIRREDIELIMNEMEVTRQVAERKLRDHKGDAKAVLVEMLTV